MIEIKNLQKILDNRTAVDIPALEVPAGMVTAIVGPAGSGKEALFDLLVGKSRPSAGTIRLAGIDPATQRARFSQAVGVLFPEDGLYLHKSPLANLAFQCQLYGLPRRRAEEVLAQIGLADQSGAHLDKLPSGLVRRLGFGRAILHNPAVLILFEPSPAATKAPLPGSPT
jgi:ABC-2 type transport system ATP-binding protein